MADNRDAQQGGEAPDDGATIVPVGGDRPSPIGDAGDHDAPPSPSGSAPDEGATLVPRGSGESDADSGIGGGFTGSLADRFEILGPLGEGGMGVVLKARDKRLGREVALKRLKGDSVESHRLIDRFEREARTVAGLEHPNIVRIYTVFDDADGLVIEMELVDGGSLQQRIDVGGALPVEEVVRIGVQLCEALEAAHARGIVHRDIKPGNVLLTRRGTPKLADFGLAVERAKAGDGRQTVTGSLLGTPHYAAPEQLIDGKGVDARADVYALGATLYAASTGTSPRAIRLDRVPESIRGVISKCMEERAEDRYQSASEMAEALRESSGKASTTRLPAEPSARTSPSSVLGTCPTCGAGNEADVRFCGTCGGDLLEKCPKCGRENRAGTRFCGGCRTEVSSFRESADLLAGAGRSLQSWDLEKASEALSRLKQLGTHGDETSALGVRLDHQVKAARSLASSKRLAESGELKESLSALTDGMAEAMAAEQRDGYLAWSGPLARYLAESGARTLFGWSTLDDLATWLEACRKLGADGERWTSLVDRCREARARIASFKLLSESRRFGEAAEIVETFVDAYPEWSDDRLRACIEEHRRYAASARESAARSLASAKDLLEAGRLRESLSALTAGLTEATAANKQDRYLSRAGQLATYLGEAGARSQHDWSTLDELAV